MNRFCLWCRKELPAVPESSGQYEQAGAICESCMHDQNIFSDALSGLCQDPILVLEIYAGTYIITKTANEHARELLGKDLQEIEQHLIGNVLACAHASLPEGCGKSSLCSACTLREDVLNTGLNGPGHFDVPVTIPMKADGQAVAGSLNVSMIRSGGTVLLRLNKYCRKTEPEAITSPRDRRSF